MKIIKEANLPKNTVKCVAVSCKAFQLVDELRLKSVEVMETQPTSNLLYGLRSHSDMHFLHIGGNKLYISQEQSKNFDKLSGYGFDINVLSQPLSKDYPDDVLLNAAVIGDNIFLNPKTICKEINFTGKKLIKVKQGYAKCSICVVNSNAIITDDITIHKAALENKFDSLIISKGDITLEGMNYGFIGGCCGLIDKDIMLFNGQLKCHRDYQKIKSFLLNYHINTISFGSYPLTDIGGILPLMEK